MEFRVLKYFLSVAEEGSITAAAERLHLSQPTLTKQLMNLEDELSVKLFLRTHKGITLTQDGELLQKRGLEIMNLVEQTEADIHQIHRTVTGDIYLGVAEISALETVGNAIKEIQKQYPQIHFHLRYADLTGTLEGLERGLYDFAIVGGGITEKKYHQILFPRQDHWGIIISTENSLSQSDKIRPSDLRKLPIMLTPQNASSSALSSWLHYPISRLNVIGTFDNAHIALPLVENNTCVCIVTKRYHRDPWGKTVRFIPFDPPLHIANSLIWNRGQKLSQAGSLFLAHLQALIEPYSKAQPEDIEADT